MNILRPLNTERSRQRLCELENLLRKRRMSAKEAGEAMHVSEQHAMHMIRRLRAEKRAYLCAWRKVEGERTVTMVFARGNKPDAPRPAVKTRQQIKREVKQRLLADPDRREAYLAKQRAYYWMSKPRRDPVVAALFGRT